ncbi:MAG TPA: hypothetical protein VIK52_14520 [Opitutaceae bacterium]
MSFLWQAVERHPEISDRVYNRFLRYPVNRPLEGQLAGNAAWAREWFRVNAHPWCCAIRANVAASERAAVHLPGAGEYAIIAASAGPEPEAEATARWTDDEPDRYFFIDSFASAIVEALVADARKALGADHHYSPGYRGWSVEDNRLLLDAFRQAGPLPGPLSVLPSGMLTPKKSQLAVCLFREPADANS